MSVGAPRGSTSTCRQVSFCTPADEAHCTGWAFEAVVSRVRLRRIHRNGRSSFAVVAVWTFMVQEYVDIVAGHFNGASWRRKRGPDPRFDSTLEEAFEIARLLVPPGPSPLWCSGGIPDGWTDVCAFVKPPKSQLEWLNSETWCRLKLTRQDLGLPKRAIMKFGNTSATSVRLWLIVRVINVTANETTRNQAFDVLVLQTVEQLG